jgi:hypothetical protein
LIAASMDTAERGATKHGWAAKTGFFHYCLKLFGVSA